MALITVNEAVLVLKKKKPRRRNREKVYNQITDLDEYRVKNNPDEIEKETK